jgi:hypothetical protein
LKNLFEIKIDIASRPRCTNFKRFQKAWLNINVKNFYSGLEDTFVFQLVQDFKENLLIFGKNQLLQFQPQDGFKELLNLLIYFQVKNLKMVYFSVPGPTHHTRWMEKAFYTLKIFLFRNEFKLTLNEHNAFHDLCIFIARIYVK